MTEAAATLPITVAQSWVAWLPLVAVLIPVAGALAVAIAGGRERVRNTIAIATCAGVLACLMALYGPVYEGITRGGRHFAGVALALPRLFATGLTFRVVPAGLIFGLVTSLIWLLAVIYATSYMAGEHARARYDAFILLSLAGNIGVFLVGDFVSLFVFFEVMAIASYVVVVHGQNPQSMKAGRLYMYMSVAGGLVLLGGIWLLFGTTGHVAIAPAGAALARLPAWLAYGVPILMILGFGTKAGMFFLHVWLPEAHPVAPSPASALLSALMVKVGVYGIMLTANVVLIPGHEAGGAIMHWVGFALIGAAVVTMVGGMVNACFCTNTKELLAFSTISQVGYILLGLGCAAYLGAEGAVGIAGALSHTVTHATFKAGLFLAIGAVMWRAKEQHIPRLGGLAYKMPWTAAMAFLATLSIIGLPGTGGFLGKSLLHHAVLEVIESSAHGGGLAAWRFLLVEALFVGVAAGTFAYSTRMFILVFMGRVPNHLKNVRPESWPMRIAYIPLMALIIVVGFFPNAVLERLIGPALSGFGLDARGEVYRRLYDVAAKTSTLPILYDPRHFAPLSTPAVSQNLLAVGSAIFFAGTFYLVGHKIGVFEMPLPQWFSLAHWYRVVGRWVVRIVSGAGGAVDGALDQGIQAGGVRIWLPKKPTGTKPPDVVGGLAHALSWVAAGSAVFDRLVDRLLAGAFVDAWLAEPVPGAPPPREGHELRLTSVATWAAEADRRLDAALSTLMVDAWTSERAQERVTKADRAVDTAVSKVMVDAWMSEPVLTPAKAPRERPAWGVKRDRRFWLNLAWRVALTAIGLTVIWLALEIGAGRVRIP